MQIAIPYASTLIIWSMIIVGITQIIWPIFRTSPSVIFLADPFRMMPAAAFYAAYIVGVLYFKLSGSCTGRGKTGQSADRWGADRADVLWHL